MKQSRGISCYTLELGSACGWREKGSKRNMALCLEQCVEIEG